MCVPTQTTLFKLHINIYPFTKQQQQQQSIVIIINIIIHMLMSRALIFQ